MLLAGNIPLKQDEKKSQQECWTSLWSIFHYKLGNPEYENQAWTTSIHFYVIREAVPAAEAQKIGSSTHISPSQVAVSVLNNENLLNFCICFDIAPWYFWPENKSSSFSDHKNSTCLTTMFKSIHSSCSFKHFVTSVYFLPKKSHESWHSFDLQNNLVRQTEGHTIASIKPIWLKCWLMTNSIWYLQ